MVSWPQRSVVWEGRKNPRRQGGNSLLSHRLDQELGFVRLRAPKITTPRTQRDHRHCNIDAANGGLQWAWVGERAPSTRPTCVSGSPPRWRGLGKERPV